MVNSAGITRDGYMLKMSEADYDAVLNVNLKGTFNVSQAFTKMMVEAKVKGSVINIASVSGTYNGRSCSSTRT